MRILLAATGAALLLSACGQATNAPAAKGGPAAPLPKAPSNAALPVTGRPAPNAPGDSPVVGYVRYSCERGQGSAVLPAFFDFGPDTVTMTITRDGESLVETWPIDASGHVEGSRGPRRQDPRWIGDFRAAPPPQRAVGQGIFTIGLNLSPTEQPDENVPVCTLRFRAGTAAQRGEEPPP